jgi:hypothetical protein
MGVTPQEQGERAFSDWLASCETEDLEWYVKVRTMMRLTATSGAPWDG